MQQKTKVVRIASKISHARGVQILILAKLLYERDALLKQNSNDPLWIHLTVWKCLNVLKETVQKVRGQKGKGSVLSSLHFGDLIPFVPLLPWAFVNDLLSPSDKNYVNRKELTPSPHPTWNESQGMIHSCAVDHDIIPAGYFIQVTNSVIISAFSTSEFNACDIGSEINDYHVDLYYGDDKPQSETKNGLGIPQGIWFEDS